jgi:hypothetical protein
VRAVPDSGDQDPAGVAAGAPRGGVEMGRK